jgi:butyryl-CoA dehydrogenase
MDFELTEEQKMLRGMCRKFADEVIAPMAEEMDRTGDYPYNIMDKMADLGMMENIRLPYNVILEKGW